MYCITVNIDNPQHRILIKAFEGLSFLIKEKKGKTYELAPFGYDIDKALKIRSSCAKNFEGIPEFIYKNT